MLSWLPSIIILIAYLSVFLMTGHGIISAVTFFIMMIIEGLHDMGLRKIKILEPGLAFSIIIAGMFDGFIGLYFFLMFFSPVLYHQMLDEELKDQKIKKNRMIGIGSSIGYLVLSFYIFKLLLMQRNTILSQILCAVFHILASLTLFAILYRYYYKIKNWKKLLTKLAINYILTLLPTITILITLSPVLVRLLNM
ncbi:MAG: hypothetical protein ABIJ34_03175 [archaeon]